MPNTHSTLTNLFTDIADAIREKTGDSAEIVADDFPTAIAGIEISSAPASSSVHTGTFTPAKDKLTWEIDVGFSGCTMFAIFSNTAPALDTQDMFIWNGITGTSMVDRYRKTFGSPAGNGYAIVSVEGSKVTATAGSFNYGFSGGVTYTWVAL